MGDLFLAVKILTNLQLLMPLGCAIEQTCSAIWWQKVTWLIQYLNRIEKEYRFVRILNCSHFSDFDNVNFIHINWYRLKKTPTFGCALAWRCRKHAAAAVNNRGPFNSWEINPPFEQYMKRIVQWKTASFEQKINMKCVFCFNLW